MVFTAGLGENQVTLRERICEYLSCLGIKVDTDRNNAMIHGNAGKISADDSSVEVFVIPTNEELVIARDTKAIVEGKL